MTLSTQARGWLVLMFGIALGLTLTWWESRLEERACLIKINRDLKYMRTEQDTITYFKSGRACL